MLHYLLHIEIAPFWIKSGTFKEYAAYPLNIRDFKNLPKYNIMKQNCGAIVVFIKWQV